MPTLLSLFILPSSSLFPSGPCVARGCCFLYVPVSMKSVLSEFHEGHIQTRHKEESTEKVTPVSQREQGGFFFTTGHTRWYFLYCRILLFVAEGWERKKIRTTFPRLNRSLTKLAILISPFLFFSLSSYFLDTLLSFLAICSSLLHLMVFATEEFFALSLSLSLALPLPHYSIQLIAELHLSLPLFLFLPLSLRITTQL